MNKFYKAFFSTLTIISLFAAIGHCSSKGTSGAQFLKIVASPRAAALGSAYTAFSDDINSITFNPAGMAYLKNKEASLVQNNWIQNISNQYVAFGMPYKTGVVGFNMTILSLKDIDKRDTSGTNIGSFEASDIAIGLSYAKPIKETVSLGFTLKMINQKIDDQSASGIAADAGVVYKASPKFDLGASITNAGSGIKFINVSDPLPTTLRIGTCYKPVIKNFKVGMDACFPNDADANFGLGTEYNLKAGEKMIFPVRVGYRSGYDTEELSGFAAGAGLTYNSILTFDFAWVPMGILGDSMKFGLSFKF